MTLPEGMKRFFKGLVGLDGDAAGPSNETLQAVAKLPPVPNVAPPEMPKGTLPLAGQESIMSQKANGTTDKVRILKTDI
jgi:hypothetical protein